MPTSFTPDIIEEGTNMNNSPRGLDGSNNDHRPGDSILKHHIKELYSQLSKAESDKQKIAEEAYRYSCTSIMYTIYVLYTKNNEIFDFSNQDIDLKFSK